MCNHWRKVGARGLFSSPLSKRWRCVGAFHCSRLCTYIQISFHNGKLIKMGCVGKQRLYTITAWLRTNKGRKSVASGRCAVLSRFLYFGTTCWQLDSTLLTFSWYPQSSKVTVLRGVRMKNWVEYLWFTLHSISALLTHQIYQKNEKFPDACHPPYDNSVVHMAQRNKLYTNQRLYLLKAYLNLVYILWGKGAKVEAKYKFNSSFPRTYVGDVTNVFILDNNDTSIPRVPGRILQFSDGCVWCFSR